MVTLSQANPTDVTQDKHKHIPTHVTGSGLGAEKEKKKEKEEEKEEKEAGEKRARQVQFLHL